jgi:photosystem II stability/assembly factor-like uncharacterized protein
MPMNPIFHDSYHAPHRTDNEGAVWYCCLRDMNFATARVGWAAGSSQLVRTQDGGKTWVNQRNDYISNTFFDPRRVCATGQAHCWVITGGMGKIRCFHTKDGGQTWVGLNLGPSTYPKDIFFINRKQGLDHK